MLRVNLAVSLLASGELVEAEQLIQRATDAHQSIYPDSHWRIRHARGVYGSVLSAQGRFDEAEPLLLNAYAAIRDTFGTNTLRTRRQAEIVGRFYRTWGNVEGEQSFRAMLSADAVGSGAD